jgi:hypothetical protein
MSFFEAPLGKCSFALYSGFNSNQFLTLFRGGQAKLVLQIISVFQRNAVSVGYQ